MLQTLVLPAREERQTDRTVIARVLVVVPCADRVSNVTQGEVTEDDSRSPFMFLYLRWQSPTPQAYGLKRFSASFSTSLSSASLRVTSPSALSPAAFAFSLRLFASSSWRCSRSFGGAKLHEPCVMWYLRPFACLYDLLQFGFGHLNGFDSRSDEAGRDRVVDARGVELAPAVELDAPADEDA